MELVVGCWLVGAIRLFILGRRENISRSIGRRESRPSYCVAASAPAARTVDLSRTMAEISSLSSALLLVTTLLLVRSKRDGMGGFGSRESRRPRESGLYLGHQRYPPPGRESARGLITQHKHEQALTLTNTNTITRASLAGKLTSGSESRPHRRGLLIAS